MDFSQKINNAIIISKDFIQIYHNLIKQDQIIPYLSITTKQLNITHKTIDHMGEIQFIEPYIKNSDTLICPEMRENNKLPFKLNYRYCFHSVGQYILYYIFNSTDTQNLEYLKNTPLFWFIKRCMDSDPNKRLLLYV